MTLYQKIQDLEKTVNNGNTLPLTKLPKQSRVITGVKNGNIIYTHGSQPSTSYFSIDLLYKSYLLLQTMGELSKCNLEHIDANYTLSGTPCNAVTFMLLMNYFFNCKIKGSGTRNSPYVVIWQ